VISKKPKKPWTLELGASVSDEGVRFRVWAPAVTSISLVIEDESKEIPMDPEGKGYFTTFLSGAESRMRYSYLLNANQIRPDPISRFQPEGVKGPSEVIDPDEFKWKDQTWRGIPLEKMIIYEIHTGTFTDEGTFEAIIPFLAYFKKDLGVTAIELMPVAQFPGTRNWGYDGTYLYAPQNSYGGPKGLKSLINACHQKGLAVILDVVYNHLGPEGNYLSDYAPYFTDRYKTPWGSAVNFDGPESDEVRRFITDNAVYWITEYHLDGIRIDAVHGIFDFSARHILLDIREEVQHQAKNLSRQIAVIAESDLNDVRIINPPGKGGYGLDAQWNDDFHHCLHTLLTQERNGYYEDFGDISQMVKALREGFVYTGQYSSYRRRRHGSSSKHLSPAQFVVFSQNHDQVGNRMIGERLSTLVSFEALKLAAGVVLLSPNIPLLFMGEEYGEEAPFQYFVSHSDDTLIEAVRRGRREEFAGFGWQGDIPDPQSEETFLLSKIHLDLHRQGKHKTLFELYRTLLKCRKEIPSLSHLSKAGMEVKAHEEEATLIMRRRHGEDRIFGIFNFSEKPAEVRILVERGQWQKVLDSSSDQWGGPGSSLPEPFQSSGSDLPLKVHSFSFVLYHRQNEKNSISLSPRHRIY
jgi:maltooligosyltrehalose trehalohydrolase